MRPLESEEAREGRGEVGEGLCLFFPLKGKGEAARFRKTTSIIRYFSPHTCRDCPTLGGSESDSGSGLSSGGGGGGGGGEGGGGGGGGASSTGGGDD